MKTIPLTKELFAFVDEQDFDLVNQSKWHTATAGQPSQDGELPRPYGQGFPVQREALKRCLSPGVYSDGSRPIQDVDCGVVVTIKRDSTEWAIMHPVRKGLRDSLSANATNYARVMGRDFLDRATSFFRFVCKVVEKLSPSGI